MDSGSRCWALNTWEQRVTAVTGEWPGGWQGWLSSGWVVAVGEQRDMTRLCGDGG